MCKGLHGLATNWNECKFSFLTQHLLPVYTFVAPAPANECAECSHVVCCDAFWFTWISLGFLSVWNQTKPWDEAASLQTHQLIQSKQAIGVKAPLESPASPTKTVCEQTPVWLINKEKAAVCVHFYVMYMILYMYLTVMMPVLFFVFFNISDCVCSAVLSPEEDSTQRSKGESLWDNFSSRLSTSVTSCRCWQSTVCFASFSLHCRQRTCC